MVSSNKFERLGIFCQEHMPEGTLNHARQGTISPQGCSVLMLYYTKIFGININIDQKAQKGRLSPLETLSFLDFICCILMYHAKLLKTKL